MKKIKLAFVVGDITSTGGIERSVSRVSDILIERGYNITIISLFKAHKKTTYEFNSKVKFIYLSEKEYATSKQGGIKRLLMFLSSLFKFRKYFQSIKNNFDLFVGCGFPVNCILFFSSIANKSIAAEHTYFHYYSSFISKLRALIYKKFQSITALTKRDTELFRGIGLNCYHVPNPLTFTSKKQSNLSSKRIIAVGRLSPEKGFEDIIEAMPEIIKKDSEWSLHIYGEGFLREELQNKINSLTLQNHVFLEGNCSDIKTQYVNSSIFVLSSRFEGFAIVILEAAACGLPIISYDCPNGPGEILEDNKGVLIPEGNKEILKEKLTSFISNPDLLRKYAKEGSRILAPFSDKIISDNWDNLIEVSIAK